MKHHFISILFFVLAIKLSAQNIYTITADSVKRTGSNDSTELILQNHTRGIPGFLYNTGNGRAAFK
jgi:hypothetical protein